VYGDTGVMEMDGATGSTYLGDPGVDRLTSELASHLIVSHIIRQRITHSTFLFM